MRASRTNLALMGASALLAAWLTGCKRPAPAPPPAPMPPPIYVPSRKMETSRLFNGMRIHSTVETISGTNATVERNNPESYTLNLEVKVKVPQPHASIEALSHINPQLPSLLPGLGALIANGKPSEFFNDLYRRKVVALNYDLPRLNEMLSRHNFFDCETILELEFPATQRRALLIQADMDVVMDGSDSDRVPIVDGSSANFQPTTSYKWPKKTSNPNNFLPGREQRLATIHAELAQPGISPSKKEELRKRLNEVSYEIAELKRSSFLVSTTDPFVVVPGSLYFQKSNPFAPRLGDYCVVIYGDTLYPAIVGDVGPTYKIGEASLRLSKQINTRATAYNRPVDELKATYLIFPGSADKPFAAPDLEKWRERCHELLKEIGGYHGRLFVWEDLTKPKPTPTPTPTPTATPSPSSTPAASPSPALSPSGPASPPSPSPLRLPLGYFAFSASSAAFTTASISS